MRTVLSCVFLTLFAVAASADPAYIRVRVDVKSDSQRVALVTRITREIRKSPDVVIVDADENLRVSVVCQEHDTAPGIIACAINYIRPFRLGNFKSSIRPQNEALFDALAKTLDENDQVVLQQIITVGTSRLDQLASDVGDTLNARFIESLRSYIQSEILPKTEKH